MYPHEIMEEHMDGWLVELAEYGNFERLMELKEQIERLLAANEDADEETAE